jgi:hypothetical protein
MTQKTILVTALTVLALCGATLLFLVDPSSSQIYPPCPSRLLTGFFCPGCGSLRALHHLLRGDLPGALSLDPLLVASIPVIGILLIRPRLICRLWIAWLGLAVLLAFGIARNIPCMPFLLLAPH